CQLLQLKADKPLWGAPKLRHKLLGQIGPEHCPAESTISEILRRHGLSARRGRARRAVPSEQPLAHCQQANQVWCADFKGWDCPSPEAIRTIGKNAKCVK